MGKKKRRQLTNKRKRFLITKAFLALFLFLGIGYSALSTNLNILGSIKILSKTEDGKLYDVLKRENQRNGLVRRFSMAHSDSMSTEESKKSIYHWYAENANDKQDILNKSNVLFANHCWQMYRTTDTGGIRMIYNGESSEGKCLDNRGKHVGYYGDFWPYFSSGTYFGDNFEYDSSAKNFKLSGNLYALDYDYYDLQGAVGRYSCKSTSESATCKEPFLGLYRSLSSEHITAIKINDNVNYYEIGSARYMDQPFRYSISNVGYMFNNDDKTNQKGMSNLKSLVRDYSLFTSFYFADEVEFDGSNYKLVDPFQVSSADEFATLAGKYTLRRNADTTSYEAFYIVEADNDSMRYITLSNGNVLEDVSVDYYFSDTITENEDGTYTLNNPIKVNNLNYYYEYNNAKKKYSCGEGLTTCENPWYVYDANAYNFYYYNKIDTIMFSNSFTWDSTNQKYVLSDDRITKWRYDDLTELNNHHYTCLNNTDSCSKIYYVYRVDNNVLYYLTLSNGNNINDKLNTLLNNDNVNEKGSIIKLTIDDWYKRNLLNYTDYLEDSIYCADRTISDYAGFNPNGGDVTRDIIFGNSNGLACDNITDRFSTTNEKAKLKYPVALANSKEMEMLSSDQKTPFTTQSPYYLMNAHSYFPMEVGYNQKDIRMNIVNTDGTIISDVANYGFRPVITLKPNTEFSGGNGSKENPYVVETN